MMKSIIHQSTIPSFTTMRRSDNVLSTTLPTINLTTFYYLPTQLNAIKQHKRSRSYAN